jgi:hemolysin activation/secretion protein
MKLLIYYAILLCFLPIVVLASYKEDSTNGTKYSYGNSHHKVNTIRNNKLKSIKTQHSYVHKTYLGNSYYIKKSSIKVEGIEFAENIDFFPQKYLNKAINNDDLMKLSDEITKYFLAKDYLLPQVTINEIELRKGNLNIKVRIENISDIIFIGETNELIQNYAKKILENKPTKIKHTQRYLVLMNTLPGYDVQYKLQENIQDELNKKESMISLVIMVTKAKAVSFVNMDNYGVNDLGKAQIMQNSSIFSAFMPGDVLSFTGLTTNHPDRLYDIGVRYGIQVNDEGTRVTASASHEEDNITTTTAVSAQDSFQNKFGLTVMHPLYLTASKTLELSLGTYYNKAVNYGLFNIAKAGKTDDTRYWSANLGIEYLFYDKYSGHNIINTHFIQGIDGSYNYYEDPTITKDTHFNLLKFDFYRQQELSNDFSLFGHFAVHYSDKLIPDQEKFGLGGREFGRGYAFYTIDGNQLVAFSIEARYKKAIEYYAFKELEPYIFYDVGYVGKQSSGTDISNISSVGSGVRIKLDKEVEFSFEVAQPLNKSYQVGGEDMHSSTRINMFANKIFRF